MWHPDFDQRLSQWRDLRTQAAALDLDSCLLLINDWWWRVPTVNHYLHWDDHSSWPGPWELLADNIYCELARATAMLYTVSMLGRSDVQQIELIQTKRYNLVQVDGGKYILNWCPGEILNIQSVDEPPLRKLSSTAFQHLLG